MDDDIDFRRKQFEIAIDNILKTIDEEQLFGEISITTPKYVKINERVQLSVKILNKKLNYFDTKKQEEIYNSKLGELDFEENEIFQDMMILYLSVGSSTFELMKMFLYLILDKSKVRITERMSLGALINILGNKLYGNDENLKKNLRELFQVDFRNQIAHEKWYIKEREFTYFDEDDDDKEHQLSLKELRYIFVNLCLVWNFLTKIYNEKYLPK